MLSLQDGTSVVCTEPGWRGGTRSSELSLLSQTLSECSDRQEQNKLVHGSNSLALFTEIMFNVTMFLCDLNSVSPQVLMPVLTLL